MRHYTCTFLLNEFDSVYDTWLIKAQTVTLRLLYLLTLLYSKTLKLFTTCAINSSVSASYYLIKLLALDCKHISCHERSCQRCINNGPAATTLSRHWRIRLLYFIYMLWYILCIYTCISKSNRHCVEPLLVKYRASNVEPILKRHRVDAVCLPVFTGFPIDISSWHVLYYHRYFLYIYGIITLLYTLLVLSGVKIVFYIMKLYHHIKIIWLSHRPTTRWLLCGYKWQ